MLQSRHGMKEKRRLRPDLQWNTGKAALGAFPMCSLLPAFPYNVSS